MRKFLSIWLFFLVILVSIPAFSQKFLALDKGGKSKRIKFFNGDYIHLTTNEKESVFGQIDLLKDSSLIIASREIYIQDIKSIHLKDRYYGLSLISNLSWVAGLGYFALDSGNRLINKENPIIQEGTIKTGVIFLGVSLLSKSITNRTFRIKNRHRLKIIDISI